jgi:hypothetical protein
LLKLNATTCILQEHIAQANECPHESNGKKNKQTNKNKKDTPQKINR